MTQQTPAQKAAHTRKARAKLTALDSKAPRPYVSRMESFDRLRKLAPTDSTVYTVIRHVSSSGMARKIDVYAIIDNRPVWLSSSMSNAFPDTFKHRTTDGRKDDALYVTGAGMDMGFHVVYTLASLLYGDGYALRQQWI